MRVFYAGEGHLEVGVAGRFEELPRTVRLSVPRNTYLTSDTARSLAVALIEHAAQAERWNQQKGAS